jgi:acetyl-CoA acetyltransferase
VINDVAVIGAGLHPFGRFDGKSAMQMAVNAIHSALADAGVEWKDIQFAVGGSWTVANPDAIVGMVGLTGIPFTDVFNACAEVIHMAEAGFCANGEQEKLLADGATEISGGMPVNTDGGLIANGEPIGASGLRQLHELVRQLRGEAGDRQVPGNPRVGFAQVYGAPGTAAATILTT